MKEKETKEWNLPPEEELKLRDNFRDMHSRLDFYRLGFNQARIYACRQIIEFIEETRIPKEHFVGLINKITGGKIGAVRGTKA